MADIGKLSVQVSASSKSMPADMKKAADDLAAGAGVLEKVAEAKGKSIGQKLSDGLSKITAFGDGVYANPAKAINSMFGGVADFVGKAPLIGGIIAAPLQAVSAGIGAGIDIYEKNVDRITKLGAGAAKTGLDVGDFQLFSNLTSGAEGAERAWAKFSHRLAEAEMAGEGVRTVFDKFGMDGKALAGEFETDFTSAIGKVANRFRALPASMRGLFLRENFGRGGLEMGPTLLKGSEGVAEMKERMARMGVGVDAGLVSSVKQAEKAKKEIGMLWEGFGNQVTMAVAPALAVISERIGKLPMGFAGLGDTIIDTVGEAAIFVSRIIDGWSNGDTAERLAPYWEAFKTKGSEVVLYIVDQFANGLKAAFDIPEIKAAYESVSDWRSKADKEEQKDREFEAKAQHERFKAMGGKLTQSDEYKALQQFYKDSAGDPNRERQDDRDEAIRNFRKRWRTAGGTDDFMKGLEDVGNLKFMEPGKVEDWLTKALADVRARMKGGKAGDFDPFGKLYDRIDKLNDASKGPLGEFNEKMGGTLGLLRKIEAANPFDALRKGVGGFAAGMGDVRNLFDALGGVDLAKLDKAMPKFLGDAGKGAFGLAKEAWANRDAAGGGVWKDFDPEAGAGGDWGPTKAEIADMKKAWLDIGDGMKNFAGVMTGGASDTFLAGLKGVTPLKEGAAELDAYAQYQKLKSALGGDQHRLAGALEQGSAGAYSAIAQFEAQRPENVQVEMRRLMEFAQRQRDEQIRVGKEAADAFRNIKKMGF